jgi:hypothetical protein
VHPGKPYQEKPRLFLSLRDFLAEKDNALHMEQGEEGWILRRREGGQEARLAAANNGGDLAFENDWLKLALSAADLSVKAMKLKQEFSGELCPVEAAEMYVIARGVRTSLSFLPFESR